MSCTAMLTGAVENGKISVVEEVVFLLPTKRRPRVKPLPRQQTGNSMSAAFCFERIDDDK